MLLAQTLYAEQPFVCLMPDLRVLLICRGDFRERYMSASSMMPVCAYMRRATRGGDAAKDGARRRRREPDFI